MTAVLIIATLALGIVLGALLHRIAAELDRASVVVCTEHTRVWDAGRRQWVHRTRPLDHLRTVLVGRGAP